MRPPTKKLPSLADRFLLDEDYLSSPDGGPLSCAVLRATERATSERVVLKFWLKSRSAIDTDLREFWRHEMRQIERVRAYPGGDEVIVEILSFGETSDSFFLTTAENLAPLEHYLKKRLRDHWLRDHASLRHRVTFWQNMLRLTQAVGAMHGQGLIHGRIGLRTVYSEGRPQADVRLGGFEWCQRVTSAEEAQIAPSLRAAHALPIYSFQRDWRDLGALAATLFGWTGDDLEAPERVDREDIAYLTADERLLLRTLLQPARNRAVDAGSIAKQIESVIRDTQAEMDSTSAQYHLALLLGERSGLSSAIRVASGDLIETDERARQLEFISADIRGGAEVCRDIRGDVFLLTESLAYALRAFSSGDGQETWDIATCISAKPRQDLRYPIEQLAPIPAHKIEFVSVGDARKQSADLQATATTWTTLFDRAQEEDTAPKAVRDALLLGLIAETLYRASEVMPVKLVHNAKSGSTRLVSLVAREDDTRAQISAALRTGNVRTMLERLFELDDQDVEAEWLLTERAGLSGGGRDTARVRFHSVRRESKRRVYIFETEDRPPVSQDLFLKRAADSGTEQVIRRRLRLLPILATHRELSATLKDPRARVRSYSELPLEEDQYLQELDRSKQDALRAIWTTGPMQLVVGPPGVGKTKLVSELVRRILATDRSAKILVSAQAHQALDNLVFAIQRAVAELPGGVAELVRSENVRASASVLDQTPSRAKDYLVAIDGSELAKSAPIRVQLDLRAMREAAEAQRSGDAEIARAKRSFETSVLQSANIFCSTSNSGDLERLVDAGAQFDWVIIEEAAKATGSELLAPMLLSMRRVLVGDHNQLPPFDTDRLVDFLSDPTRVKAALNETESLAGPLFRDAGLEELKPVLEDESKLRAACNLAKRLILPFETIATEQLERQKAAGVRRPVVSQLADQHRMHPAIADLVSHSFYGNALQTDALCVARFAAATTPFNFLNERLPKSPIVVLSLPYAQKESGAEDAKPVYTNPAEVRAVLDLLANVRPVAQAGRKPSLAVLSPYNRQVRSLADGIEAASDAGLQHLAGFERSGSGTGFCGSVDSFQGSEADLVIVSLVRNNSHVLRQALGFVADPRRMNVLLSRSMHQLILVTSFDFLEVQAHAFEGLQNATGNAHYLPKLIAKLRLLTSEHLPDGTTKASIVSWRDYKGAVQ